MAISQKRLLGTFAIYCNQDDEGDQFGGIDFCMERKGVIGKQILVLRSQSE